MENKFLLPKYRPQGSALLIALVLMGMLMTLAFGVSRLVIGAIVDGRKIGEQTRAWYAAESGLEHALLKINKNGPGFEEEKRAPIEGALGEPVGSRSEYVYRIHAAASEIPSRETYEVTTPEDNFAALPLNASVTIPLFRGTNPDDSVKNLRIEYYLAPDLKLRGGRYQEDLDILRWKIFGIAPGGKMEVMNEFSPMLPDQNTAASPSCIGTDNACWNGAKFYERGPNGEVTIIPKKSIRTFLASHTQNFLVLTNIVNIDMINAAGVSLDEKKELAAIRYHIVEAEGKPNLTIPTIKISADGYSGGSQQSLDLEVPRESFLPVFNYALYRTAE